MPTAFIFIRPRSKFPRMLVPTLEGSMCHSMHPSSDAWGRYSLSTGSRCAEGSVQNIPAVGPLGDQLPPMEPRHTHPTSALPHPTRLLDLANSSRSSRPHYSYYVFIDSSTPSYLTLLRLAELTCDNSLVAQSTPLLGPAVSKMNNKCQMIVCSYRQRYLP
jgi:hypothetical protein